MTLHITNGDCAADLLRASGIGGDVLPWRDVLHEGPVPAGLDLAALSHVRADFISSMGWGDAAAVRRDFQTRDTTLAAADTHDGVVLWFEHDLYDQLQLVQLLDWFATHPHRSLQLVCDAEYLGTASPERLRARFPTRHAVTAAQLDLGRRAWEAVRSPTPDAVDRLRNGDCSALPFFGAALVRLLEELPAVGTGLSRTEHQALLALRPGGVTLEAAFQVAHDEDPVFLGDTVFASIAARLARGPEPLLDGPTLTSAGHDVLDGGRDWAVTGGLDRWLGGVHVVGPRPWRWDSAARRTVAPA
ncbi:MAG TPA: DUF1835 domain-containing protein [Candidatus Binatia bacterium]|nr:DUF1835 domain-containing protein [Candidatus Binatia bacterium]